MDNSPVPNPHSFLGWLRLYICGLCIGASDLVPGISGGTVAFIIGIYENFMDALKTINGTNFFLLIRGDWKTLFKQFSWKYLTAVIGGMITSLVALAGLFNRFLRNEEQRVYLYSLFLGLILGSIYFCSKQVRKWSYACWIAFIIGASTAFFLSGTNLIPRQCEKVYDVLMPLEGLPLASQESIKEKKIKNYDLQRQLLLDVPVSFFDGMLARKWITKDTVVTCITTQKTGRVEEVNSTIQHSWVDTWIMTCGAIAISAMLLPGISGSYMLTILGMYGIILGGLVDWVEGLKRGFFDVDAFRIVFSMALGVIVGASFFSRVTSWLLHYYHDWTIALLTGFMVGAMRAVWPFWIYEYILFPLRLQEGALLQLVKPVLPSFSSQQFAVASLFFLSGTIVVVIIEWVAHCRTKQL